MYNYYSDLGLCSFIEEVLAILSFTLSGTLEEEVIFCGEWLIIELGVIKPDLFFGELADVKHYLGYSEGFSEGDSR
jgi:hypothetical protein